MIEIFAVNLNDSFSRLDDQFLVWIEIHFVNIIAILIGAWLIRRFASNIISRLFHYTVRPDLYPTKSEREKRIRTLNTLVTAVVRVGVYIIALILIIGEINPHYMTALFASAGLIGVALGFGAKDLVKDFMSGIFIITENQYRVGDVIEISDVSGVVEDISIRTTVLRDLDGHLHHIPNGSISVTTNMTLGFSRVNEDILVAYNTDIDRLEHVINHVGETLANDAEFKSLIISPPKFLRIDGFGDNGMIVKVVGDTMSGEQWMVKGELLRRLKTAFDKNNIELPYPHVAVVTPVSKK